MLHRGRPYYSARRVLILASVCSFVFLSWTHFGYRCSSTGTCGLYDKRKSYSAVVNQETSTHFQENAEGLSESHSKDVSDKLGFVFKKKLLVLENGAEDDSDEEVANVTASVSSCSPEPVQVDVNGKRQFVGLHANHELYVPFSFLRDYYEVSGKFLEAPFDVGNTHILKFAWEHSSAPLPKTYAMKQPYTSSGRYLSFDETNVGNRARVKYIDGATEVPLSTQWDVKGYFYPTQIAQYGLSHLTKYANEGSRGSAVVYEDGSLASGLWSHTEGSTFKSVHDKGKNVKVVSFNAVADSPVTLALNAADGHSILSLDVKFVRGPSWFVVVVMASDGNSYELKYKADNVGLEVKANGLIVHGIGSCSTWTRITRNLTIDLIKGVGYAENKKEHRLVELSVKKVVRMTFVGAGRVSNISLSDQAHAAMFRAAANWLVRNQNSAGGWQVNVTRFVIKGIVRRSGWYSAMGQGQAMSLLCRAYQITKDVTYLNSALKATGVFQVPATGDGVLAYLHGKPWYEEYPTNPSLFVLNGFMYSLLGLYDLWKAAGDKDGALARQLWLAGLDTLESCLPLFDNGQGSFYDLRHLTLPGTPPNRARGHYHVVHLELLQAIVDITGSKVISVILDRWHGYHFGEQAKHN